MSSPPNKPFDWQAVIEKLPASAGVYLMKNHQGQVVYVGKSINLKARVRSYFQGHDTRPFVARLNKILAQIDTVLTENEKEALLLENNLIKQHRPRYNVLLRDDKTYLSLAIDRTARWPRVVVARRQRKKGVRYFGPYHSARAARQTLALLNQHFMLRTCPDTTLNNRARPCLQYQIKRCPAPCVYPVDHAEYMERVDEAILFLEGKTDALRQRLTVRMQQASESLEFELAARYRDQLRDIERVMQPQSVEQAHRRDQDAFGYYREGDRITLQVMQLRQGKLQHARSFHFKDHEVPTQELLSSFLNLYYQSGPTIPHEVLVPVALQEADAIAEVLSEMRGRRVTLLTPRRGKKRQQVQGAMRNAAHQFAQASSQSDRTQDLLGKLSQRLKLAHYPHRIECFDISNFQGSQIVGSMVVFEDGVPDKRAYRHFKIRSATTQDDFASMYEVLMRRFKRAQSQEWPKPDLVVIDGGKGQLGQAIAVLSDLGIHDVDVVSLAKARVSSDVQASQVVKSPERVFLPGRKNPVILRQNSAELFLLTRLRDEAHRSAIAFHRKQRRKATIRSVLDDIEGVGPKRRKALLDHFGGLSGIRTASLEELAQVEGVSITIARQVYAFFQKGTNPSSQDPRAPNT